MLCFRFCGLSSDSSRVAPLLHSLCTQLAAAYGAPPPHAADAPALPASWQRRYLSLATYATEGSNPRLADP